MTLDKLKAACIQLNNTPDRAANTKVAVDLIRQASSAGADLICTPEYSCQMVAVGITSRLAGSQPEEMNEQLKTYRSLASELNKWILVGSLGVKVAEDRIANRSYLLNGKGDIVARYDKIHMFDVDLPDGQTFRESSVARAGNQAVVAATPWGGIGMSICYDVRFAYLFRAMAQAGARILTVPSAYSIPTGKATWEIFNRTRAAETGSFVISPAQWGLHEAERRTWGHSLIVGPWGQILAELPEGLGFITADLNLAEVEKARADVPAIYNDRRDFKLMSEGVEPLGSNPLAALKKVSGNKGM